MQALGRQLSNHTADAMPKRLWQRRCARLPLPCQQETLQPSEWLAVAFAGAGTIGLGATTEEAPGGAAVGTLRAVVVLSAFVIALGRCLAVSGCCLRTLSSLVSQSLSCSGAPQRRVSEESAHMSCRGWHHDVSHWTTGVLSVLRLARRRHRRARGAAPPAARSTAYMYGLQASVRILLLVQSKQLTNCVSHHLSPLGRFSGL